MTELNRTEAKLTTADIAAKAARPRTVSAVQDGTTPEEIRTEDSNRGTVVRNQVNRDSAPATTASQQAQDADVPTPLFSNSDIGDLRARWSDVQAEFVDEPRRAVEDADQLVATVMQKLAEGFARERGSLEKHWDSGETASTEDLRMALQRYRAFFNRLLNAA